MSSREVVFATGLVRVVCNTDENLARSNVDALAEVDARRVGVDGVRASSRAHGEDEDSFCLINSLEPTASRPQRASNRRHVRTTSAGADGAFVESKETRPGGGA